MYWLFQIKDLGHIFSSSVDFSRLVENSVKVDSVKHMVSNLNTSVGSEPKLGSAWLGFGSSFWEKKLGLARHAFQKARLGSPYLAKKAQFSLACSII